MLAVVSMLPRLGLLVLLQQVYALPEELEDSRSVEDLILRSTRNGKLENELQVKKFTSKAGQSYGQGRANSIAHAVTALALLLLGRHPASAFVSTQPGAMLAEKRKILPARPQARVDKGQSVTLADLLIGPQMPRHRKSCIRLGSVSMEGQTFIEGLTTLPTTTSSLLNIIQAFACRSQWKLQEAVEKCGKVVSKIPIDSLNNINGIRGQTLKVAKLTRAAFNEEMGNLDESMADVDEILQVLPSDLKAKIFLAFIYHNSLDDCSKALDILSSAVEESSSMEDPPLFSLPQAVSGEFDRVWAAKEAAVVSASLGEHVQAQQYFDLISQIDQEKKLEKEELGCEFYFLEMVNALCAGDKECAAKREEDLVRISSSAPSILSAWKYIASLPFGMAPKPYFFYAQRRMLELAMDAASMSGLILEFGVWHGKSLRWIASRFPDVQVHGFDTFTGLPEDWNRFFSKGAYSSQGIPSNLPNNVQLHAGLFNETLPGFLDAHAGPIRFMNVDCDLYSSTKDIFDQVSSRIVPGTIIIFDELFFIEDWQEGEFKAFQEAVAENNWTFEYLAISYYQKQAVIRIT